MAQHNFALYLNACLPDDAPAKPVAKVEIFSLVACPTVPFGTRYKFVTVQGGVRTTIAIGRALSKYGSLNLGTIRRRGAKLGAAEVHLLT